MQTAAIFPTYVVKNILQFMLNKWQALLYSKQLFSFSLLPKTVYAFLKCVSQLCATQYNNIISCFGFS